MCQIQLALPRSREQLSAASVGVYGYSCVNNAAAGLVFHKYVNPCRGRVLPHIVSPLSARAAAADRPGATLVYCCGTHPACSFPSKHPKLLLPSDPVVVSTRTDCLMVYSILTDVLIVNRNQ
ncbi:hypothetical protein J6590_009983 [Homalodisca vitripennis]|nr:hypothetical protein J6590_009983 [Homalodisca vitripennis]